MWENNKESSAFLFHMNGHGLVTSAALPSSKKQAWTDIHCGIKLLHLTERRQGRDV